MLLFQAYTLDPHDVVARSFKMVEISLFMQVAPLAENFEQRVPTLWLRADAFRYLGVQLGEMITAQMARQVGRAEVQVSVVVQHAADSLS